MSVAKTILLLIFAPLFAKGQQIILPGNTFPNEFNKYNSQSFRFNNQIVTTYNDSAFYLFRFISGTCKMRSLSQDVVDIRKVPVATVRPSVIPVNKPPKREPVLQIHGDITYDFFYRSAIDTPYADQNVIQHGLQANIYATIKKTFPVAIQINARQSNSYLFKNYVDANIRFDGQTYQSLIKERLKAKVIESINGQSYDKLLETALREKQQVRQQVEQWLHDGKQLQQLIESKQALTAALPSVNTDELLSVDNAGSLLEDSLQQMADANEHATKYKNIVGKAIQYKGYASKLTTFTKKNLTETVKKELPENIDKATDFLKEYAQKNEKYKQYSKEIEELEAQYKSTKSETQQKIDSIKNFIDNTDDPALLQQQMKKYKLDSNKTYKWVKHLLAIKRFAIGRSMVDYSELTAKSISVTGINAEYQNRLYFAIAAGTVDYRYRDFIARQVHKTPQYLLLARAGIGNPKTNNIVFTIYRGKKQASWFNTGNEPAVNNVFGVSIEGKYSIDKNNYIIAEVAKSSYPKFAASLNNNTGSSKIFGLSDRSNEAYSIQIFSRIPATHTRLSGLYKKLGINFQSFNIFNFNANYSAWQIRADQYLFQKKLFVAASVRTNEYNSPYTVYNYKSNTIFTSVQATLRIKKWPVLTAAYMPASQLYKNGNDIIETRFSTLMASAAYMYRIRGVYMHSAVMYNKFFNDRDQQQFLYYNASGWLINHSIMGERLTLNSAANLSYNGDYRLLTLDQGMNYTLNKWLRAGGGLKWNRLNKISNAIGYYVNAQVKMKKLGEVHLTYDRGFLPGINRTLLPNDMGRAIYIKTF